MTDIPSESAAEASTGSENLESFLAAANAQVGDSFRMGAEASVRDDDPDAFDSSELVQWAAGRAGATVRDGSWNQYHQLYDKGATLDVETALKTPGALVFRFPDDIPDDPNDWDGRPDGSHVAISLGDGTVLEATTGGVRIAENGGRFTHGGSIPEITGTIETIDEPEEPEPASVEPPIEDDLVIGPDAMDDEEADEDWAEKALDLRKQALDKSQEAEEVRAQLADAKASRNEIEERILEADAAAGAKAAAVLESSKALSSVTQQIDTLQSEIATQEASLSEKRIEMDPDEAASADARLADLRRQADESGVERKQLEDDQVDLKTEWASALDERRISQEFLERYNREFPGYAADLEAEAKSLSDEAQTLRVQAVSTVTAALPGTKVKGSEDDFVVVEDPGTLEGPVSPERLRAWLAARNELADKSEDLAGKTLREAEIDEDLADAYLEVAGESRARASAERVSVETSRALIERLETRKTEAEALEKRFIDEAIQEGEQLDRLRDANDTVGADAQAEHMSDLLQRQFQWSGQVSSLDDRIEEARADIATREEDAADYDRLATELTEVAGQHQVSSDADEELGAILQDAIDDDEFVTDKVEDALTMSDKLDTDLGFHLIDGRGGQDVDIEMVRDAPSDSSESPDADADEPEEVVFDAEVAGVAAQASEPSDAAFAEIVLTEVIEVTTDPNEVFEIPEPAEIVAPEEVSPADELQNQIDAADQFADSLEDLLDDQE